MSISITASNYGQEFSSINVNSKQYKAAADEFLDAVIAEEAMMTPEQKMMYELMGGREAHMRNVMRNFNSDGDFVGPGGVVVPGMYHGKDGSTDRSTWQQIINVSDEARQKMFDNVKREFIQENGISNGDTTKRSKIFRQYQLSVRKEDRAKGTWTLQQYEGNYRSAMYATVKAANPNWKPGQPFDSGILDSVTRESVESNLVQSGNKMVRNTIDYSI